MEPFVRGSLGVLLVLTSTVVLGQGPKLTHKEVTTLGAVYVMFYADSPAQIVALAEQDIHNEVPFLLLSSGLAPVTYGTDSLFENRFRVFYKDEGCISPPVAAMSAYNQRIFQFLEEKYGRVWLKSIRKDVVGLREWRRRYKS